MKYGSLDERVLSMIIAITTALAIGSTVVLLIGDWNWSLLALLFISAPASVIAVSIRYSEVQRNDV